MSVASSTLLVPFALILSVRLMSSSNNNATVWSRNRVVDPFTWIDTNAVRVSQERCCSTFGHNNASGETSTWDNTGGVLREQAGGIRIGGIYNFLGPNRASRRLNGVIIRADTCYGSDRCRGLQVDRSGFRLKHPFQQAQNEFKRPYNARREG